MKKTAKTAANTTAALMDMGSYWLDPECRNTWDKKWFSQHEAEIAAASLKLCYNTHNCEYCSDCEHVTDCKYCYDVQFSRSCTHCERSSHLAHCENCSNLKFASFERDIQK